ncbi:S-adenosyl-L-methionine-dependent methyltransferase [Mycena floridula]|nr:S-adenosyl-L-methionine-dependent methyltransferase [Mycena floridula]
MASPLQALVALITAQVENLEATYSKSQIPFPSLDEPFRPSPLDFDPKLAETRRLIVAAAAQLIATVRSPPEVLMEESTALYTTTNLTIVEEINISDVLAEGPATGMHLDDISAVNGVDASYMGRILRYLATRHIYKEVSPNVFVNNRISSLLKKRKTVQEIKADPESRFEGAALPALISQFADLLPIAPYVSGFIQNPVVPPFNAAFKTESKMWDWLAEPGHEFQQKRYAVAMSGAATQHNTGFIVSDIDAKAFKPDDVVVDVGGGIGTATEALWKACPNLKFVVQDLENQIKEAGPYWEAQENGREALKSGQVTLQVHTFFDPQPVKNAAVYFLRYIIHNWPDKEAKQIMSQLRAAAGPTSKLVVLDTIAQHTCTVSGGPQVPFPLLANLGTAGAGFSTAMDMGMLSMNDAKERLEAEFEALGQETGWKLESVKPGNPAALTYSVI